MEMKINHKLVRELRTNANWSQEELAAVSGLSLRTIQRVENDGTASLETRKALASAFGVSTKGLDLVGTAYQPGEMAFGTGMLMVWIGIAWYFSLGLGAALVGVGAIYLLGQLLRVALHKLPVLWELIAVGGVCLLAGVGTLVGYEVRLGGVILVAIGCQLMFSKLKA